jgi:hypothetical protein
MTVLAAEAGAGAVEAEGAEASAASRSATAETGGARTRPQRRPSGGGFRPPRPSGVARAARTVNPGKRVAALQASTQSRPRPRRAPGVSRSQEFRKGFPGSGPASSNYHGVILAEWAIGFLLVAAIPFSKPNQTGVSPYAGKDLVQLATFTVLYWLLAILAATGRTQARFAAWFGGLILLAVGLSEAASITAAVTSFLNPGPQPADTTTPAGNPSTVNPTTGSATGLDRPVAQAPGNGLT